MGQLTIAPTWDKDSSKENVYTKESFGYIFESYYKRVYNYIYYRINCPLTAEDLTSQVFERAMINIDKYDQKKGPFEVWLFTLAKNIVRDYLRGLKKYGGLSFPLNIIMNLISKEKTPEDLFLTKESNEWLFKVLNTLDDRERNIISLKFGGNLKNTEIAKLLNITEGNVGVILYRSMKKLKKEIEGSHNYE